HLNRIVDRVLDFARTPDPREAEVDVNQLLADLGLLLRAKLRSQRVQLVLRLGTGPLRLLGDATQLEQAFLNLALNAVEAMPDGGRLTIRTRVRRPVGDGPERIILRFRDTGTGMTPDQRDKVFTSLLSSTKPRGTGLGMAIVRRVVELHRGEIRVQSSPGWGTAFTLVLPRSR
ncbi:MAG: ATP-binding protein, partial [Verrucomicrobiota bacterium]